MIMVVEKVRITNLSNIEHNHAGQKYIFGMDKNVILDFDLKQIDQ